MLILTFKSCPSSTDYAILLIYESFYREEIPSNISVQNVGYYKNNDTKKSKIVHIYDFGDISVLFTEITSCVCSLKLTKSQRFGVIN